MVNKIKHSIARFALAFNIRDIFCVQLHTICYYDTDAFSNIVILSKCNEVKDIIQCNFC